MKKHAVTINFNTEFGNWASVTIKCRKLFGLYIVQRKEFANATTEGYYKVMKKMITDYENKKVKKK